MLFILFKIRFYAYTLKFNFNIRTFFIDLDEKVDFKFR